MKKIILTILLLTIPCLIFAQETIRTWKSKSGKTIIEAAWDSEKDPQPETVYLLKNGKRYKYPLEKLSDADQKYVTDGRAKKSQRGMELVQVDEKPLTVGGFTLPTAKKYAVLVGVTDYVTMNDLKYTVRDVEAIRDQLLEIGFQEENIQILTTGSDLANQPTQRNIQRAVKSALDQAKLGDLVFFAFTGHGAQLGDEVFFCPQDTVDEDISNTAVSITKVMEDLSKSKADFKWILVDACRNNPFRQRVAGVRSIQKIDDPPKGIALFQSCAQDEYSYEDESVEHGLFTSNFVKGMQGAADGNQDGILTFMEVCTYTTSQTVREVQQKFRANQRPYLSGNISDFVLMEDLNRPKAVAYFEAAQELRRSKKYGEAKAQIDLALKLYPKDEKFLDELDVIQMGLDAGAEKAKLAEKARLAEVARKKAESEVERLAKISRLTVPAPSELLVLSSFSDREAGERQVKTVNGVDFTFRWCPAGSFMMGSKKWYDENPIHMVNLSDGFWMLETEVTQRQWQAIMGTTIFDKAKEEMDGYDLYGTGDNYPMYYVSWNDSQDFCKKFNSLSGLKIGLPTEAQWEYACRAGSTGEYAGNLDEMGWYLGNSGRKTHEVGLKEPNAWGLYDMHGNVWEWCSDWYDSEYYSKSPADDPTGPASGSDRVIRGGSWFYDAGFCQSTSRNCGLPGDWCYYLGVRLVLAVSGSAR